VAGVERSRVARALLDALDRIGRRGGSAVVTVDDQMPVVWI
jgi:hypothetical protein